MLPHSTASDKGAGVAACTAPAAVDIAVAVGTAVAAELVLYGMCCLPDAAVDIAVVESLHSLFVIKFCLLLIT